MTVLGDLGLRDGVKKKKREKINFSVVFTFGLNYPILSRAEKSIWLEYVK